MRKKNANTTIKRSFRCLERENATAYNQTWAPVATGDLIYDPWGLNLEKTLDATYNTKYAAFLLGSNRYKYNDKESISSTRLYDYGARQYDAVIGRWLQVDPLAELDFEFSSYTYVVNNPMIFMDPSGMKRKKVGNDGDWEETDPLPELVASAKRDRFNEAMGLDMYFRGHYYLKENESYKKVHQAFLDGNRDAALVASLPFALIGAAAAGGAIISQGAELISRASLMSAGRRALWNVAGQGFGSMITGKREIDIVGFLSDVFLPGKSGAIISGYFEAGLKFQNGKWVPFREFQGLEKGTARTTIGLAVGKYQDIIGASAVSKTIQNLYEAMGKVYTESHEALFDKIDEKIKPEKK